MKNGGILQVRSAKVSVRSFAGAKPRAITRLALAVSIVILGILAGGLGAGAQSSRKDDVVLNSRGTPLAGAMVRVCTMPASGQPCTPLAQIYSDAKLTQALANPTTTDGLGNYYFYAAPGRYMIEISGPSITTRQIPDVILPSDPASPAFSNISAFSLSLSGNLTVNGNTTVVGSLASGTLTLNNQAMAPGAASPGTVNLYTKSTDKRLYYKDDTGTEIGPIANTTGAQLNVANTFTAAQNIDADFHTKGPNPWFDLSRFGGYATNATPPWTTGNITSGSTTLTLAAAQDFANGQGVVIYGAGPATALNTPPAPAVTPIWVTGGTTTYTYCAVAEDYSGGLTACSPTGTTTTGWSTLGLNTFTVTSGTRSSGALTLNVTANHIAAGANVNVCGFGSTCSNSTFYNDFNGAATASAATASTVTIQQGGLADRTDSSGTPGVQVMACNKLVFPSDAIHTVSSSRAGVLRWWIYRNGALAGVAVGGDPYYEDCGGNVQNSPSYVPATPPTSAQPGYLATTIASGGGTTTLALANAAGTTASSQTVLHTNGPNILECLQAAVNISGGTCRIPDGSALGGETWVVNSLVNLESLTNRFSSFNRLLVDGFLTLNQPLILVQNIKIEGESKQSNSFEYEGMAFVSGNAYPLMYATTPVSGVSLKGLKFNLANNLQNAVFTDNDYTGQGASGFKFTDVAVLNTSSFPGPDMLLKGGLDYSFHLGSFQNTQPWPGAPAVRFTCSSPALSAGSFSQIPNYATFEGTNFSGSAVEMDNEPSFQSTGGATLTVGGQDFHFSKIFYESGVAPFLTQNMYANAYASTFVLDDVQVADEAAGESTPTVDAENSTNVNNYTFYEGGISGSVSPLLITSSASANPFFMHAASGNWATRGTRCPMAGRNWRRPAASRHPAAEAWATK